MNWTALARLVPGAAAVERILRRAAISALAVGIRKGTAAPSSTLVTRIKLAYRWTLCATARATVTIVPMRRMAVSVPEKVVKASFAIIRNVWRARNGSAMALMIAVMAVMNASAVRHSFSYILI